MNRQIKFRAWDSEANIMIYSDHRTRKLYDAYYGFEMNEKGELECRWEGDFLESHVLDGGTLDNIMQYTGLKDKNGVEIYEGDIVEYELFGREKKMTIEYNQESASFKYCIADEIKFTFDGGNNERMAVIGDIHENPELLGGQRD
ncbi:YopX family protein [Alkalibacterium thalassium]|uniref:Phage uncharacterized protein TIGR01671 n=1 Tax=Alkalibacterium thalassium TaxID=426701 RepID=A0A1G8VR80_9LACT|nr:YopX family protein [Alkalibacterium thalassium]SDJ68598.1 phage uncharacterized protein TIGR01671 [Alkalibacterium thalassium]